MATLQARLVALANVIGADVKALLGRSHSKSITLADPSAAERLPLFYTSKAMTLVRLRAALPGGTSTPSVTYSVRFAGDASAAGTEAVTGGSVVDSATTGNDITLSVGIPAGSWVWLTTTAKNGAVPTLALTLEFL